MTTTTLAPHEASILARVISPEEPAITQAVAEEFLRWSFSDADRSRMSELAAKARAGTLAPAEVEEADAYERVSSFLGLVKSKARRSLKSLASQ